MFLPISRQEVEKLGWDYIDVILISGDAYIDSPFSGIAVVGKYLLKHGFRVAVISQPDIDCDKDITMFGEPRLFWGISAGCVDSMVANYTSSGKPRKQCDFTPNGINNKRPDRASIVYTTLIRRYFKNTKPIVLGGIEASLRRIAHYDFKTDKVRRSILFDAKADYIIYGMGELPVLELAKALDRYNAEVKGREKRYIQHGSRWSNKSYVDYLDENYQGEPSAGTKASAADQHAKNILDLFERAHAVCN